MHRLYIFKPRANNGVRTRDPQLGKLMLYQLSYIRNYDAKIRIFIIRRPRSIIFSSQTEQLNN